MDSDSDYEWDGGGENFHDHHNHHAGDSHIAINIGGYSYTQEDLEYDMRLIGVYDCDDYIDGEGDLTAEVGLYGDDDIDGGSDRYLTAELGIDGGGDEFNFDRYGGDDGIVPLVESHGDDDDVDQLEYHNNRSSSSYQVEDFDDEALLVYSSRSGTAFRLLLDGHEDLPVTRDDSTSTREITVQASQHLIESNSNPNVRRNEEEKDGDSAKKLKNDEMATSSEQDNANGSEDDGVSCPICFEPWITYGDHIICCLPCGHVYGFSCIKMWLLQSNSRKCPQCNEVCSVADIRKIYGLNIVTVEKDLKEKIQLLEAKCASLEHYNADLQRKEAEWHQSEAVLVQQLKSVAKE